MGKGAGGSQKMEVNKYRLSLHLGLGWELDGISRITVGEKVAWEGTMTEAGPIYINQPGLFGGEKKEGGVVGIAHFLPGRPTQVMPNALAARFGLTSANCPAFRGVSTLFFVGSSATNMTNVQVVGVPFNFAGADYQGGFYWAANSPFIQPVSVTGWCAPRGLNPDFAMIGPDANPIHIIYECMTDVDFGMGAPSTQFNLANWEGEGERIFDEEFGLSLKWNSQMLIEDFVGEVIDHIHATLYVNPRTGLLEIKLLRDDYDIEALREINPGNANFTDYARKMWGETANEIVVSWTNPENEQEETVTAHDLGNIAAQGATISDSRNFYAIRNAGLAARVAAREVRMSSAPLASVEVELDRSFWDIVPGELLKVTWPEKKLDRLIMRVMTVGYGKKGDPAVKVTLLEDVFSLIKPPAAAAPGTGWDGASEPPAEMEFAQVFTLPAFLASRQLGSTVTSLAYPEVVAGVLAFQPGNDTISYNLYYESPLANGDMVWADGGVKSILGRAKMITPVYQEALSEVDGLPLIEMNRGPKVSGFVVFGDGADGESEIALLRAIDEEDGHWTLDRGVLDTVPRPWPVDTPVWFIPPNCVIADDADIRSVGEEPEYKLLTRTSRGQLDIDDAPTVSAIMSARPHLPLRPANVKVNGTGFGEVDATAATELELTWANRNRLFEDGQVVKWTDGNVAPEYLQETLITVYREDETEWFQIRGLWGETDYTIPIAWVQQEQRIFIRFSCERSGLGSLQNYGLWVKNIPQIVSPAPPPASPIVVGAPPPPPDPEPDPEPDPLPAPDPTPPAPPGGGGGGGGGRGEWVREH